MFKFDPFLILTVACVACGGTFSASNGSGGSAGVGAAGDASGGHSSSAGSSTTGDAGEMNVAGGNSAGQGPTAGTGGSPVASGGLGGGGATAGSAGADCADLQQQYEAAVEKARVCDRGSTDECSPSSVAQPVGGCGCPVLLNAKSEYTASVKQAYQDYQDAKCDSGAAICDIFCAPYTSATCTQQGMGPGNTFTCASSVFTMR